VRQDQNVSLALPKPGKALLGVMVGVTCIWVMFAAARNWGSAGDGVFTPFVGDTAKVLHGQIWRLITAAVIHHPSEPGHLLTTVGGLYFLGTTLEDRWGPRRMLLFLFGSAAFAFVVQVLLGLLIPKLAAAAWFGGLGMVEAVAVAWAMQNRGQVVRLFFVIPVSGMMLLVFVFAMSVLNVLAMKSPTEGLITPFGGMLAGYLFADSSPLRRFWLKARLRNLERQAQASGLRTAPRSRAAGNLRVIRGGAAEDDPPPKDKRYLN
jgi:membrane associated rhomboid family serine protease